MAAAYVSAKELLDEILVQLPGATAPTVLLAMKNTLREFFTDSASWRVDLEPIMLKPGKDTYYLDPPFANSDILYVHQVFTPQGTGYRELKPLTSVMAKTQQQSGGADLPLWYHGYSDVPGKISVWPLVSETAEAQIVPKVSLKYRDPWDEQIPLFVVRFHRDVIVDGTVGKMMMQQDKPYTNPAQSQYMMRRFRSGISRARDMSRRDYTESEYPTPFPPFAGRSQNRFRT